jgi:hypothetical protein
LNKFEQAEAAAKAEAEEQKEEEGVGHPYGDVDTNGTLPERSSTKSQ